MAVEVFFVDDNLPILRNRAIHMNVHAIDGVIDLTLLTGREISSLDVACSAVRHDVVQVRACLGHNSTYTCAKEFESQRLLVGPVDAFHEQEIRCIVDPFQVNDRAVNRRVQPDATVVMLAVGDSAAALILADAVAMRVPLMDREACEKGGLKYRRRNLAHAATDTRDGLVAENDQAGFVTCFRRYVTEVFVE